MLLISYSRLSSEQCQCYVNLVLPLCIIYPFYFTLIEEYCFGISCYETKNAAEWWKVWAASILLFWQILCIIGIDTLAIWTNTFWKSEQMHSAIWTNTFWNLNKCILQFGQIHFEIWTNSFRNLDKYMLKFEQIHFEIWTNTFWNLDKYVSIFRQIYFVVWII